MVLCSVPTLCAARPWPQNGSGWKRTSSIPGPCDLGAISSGVSLFRLLVLGPAASFSSGGSLMPKLIVGWSQKVGEPNYGSRGANVAIELELDGLPSDPQRVRTQIAGLFTVVRRAVTEELA